MSLSLETASLLIETVALSLVVVAGFVGAVAGDSVLSLLTAEVVSLFLETTSPFLVLVAAPVEVAFEAVALFLDIPSLLIESVVVFLVVAVVVWF